MDWDQIEGNWKQLTGKVKEQWGKLTDDDLVTIDGKREQLEGALQERYGIAKDEAKQHIDDWLDSLSRLTGRANAVSLRTKTRRRRRWPRRRRDCHESRSRRFPERG